MESHNLEFFKLDEIDRKVLLWLLSHVPKKATLSWIDYITDDYKRRKSITLDGSKLYSETQRNEKL